MTARPSAPYDALVVGAGPNGLAAAITLAQAGRSTLILEARQTVGGGARSAQLTLPGFVHDICSAIHPLGVSSPFFLSLPLAQYGLAWAFPPAAAAHPLDDGDAVIVERDVAATAARLGRDGPAYRRLLGPLVAGWRELLVDVLHPMSLPKHPFGLARFGLAALLPATTLIRLAFRDRYARAVFAGMAAHSMLPLSMPVTAGFALTLLLLGHAVGWPVARGGSQSVADALAAYLRALGGQVATGTLVRALDDLPPARALLLDLTPRQVLRLAAGRSSLAERFPDSYRRKLQGYRYGPGVCKVDWALDAPIPWRAAGCLRAATVHLGGAWEEIARAEAAVWRGEHPERPFVLLAQPTLFDPTRAPEGKHTAWAYCHVPAGSAADMTGPIEAQIERFAPGFRSRILARRTHTAAEMALYNPNYVGGDINGGVQDLRQHFTRPVARLDPYSTPIPGLYICSSATPPGGGVHGMCGYHAARSALKRSFG